MKAGDSKLVCPKVSIIIPNFRSLKDTMECLDSLRKITYPNYGVIIVQLSSKKDDARSLIENYRNYVHLIEMDEDPGKAGMENIAITYALKRGYDYILLLDNDMVVDPEFLTEMVKVAESKPEIGSVSPRLYDYHQPDRYGFPYEPSLGKGVAMYLRNIMVNLASGTASSGKYLDKVSRFNFTSGACCLLKRKMLESAGLFDPLFFWAAEDMDLSLRAKKAGFDFVVVPSAKIWHKGRGGTRAKTPFSWYYTARSPIILARKHFKFFALFLYIAYLFIFQIPIWFLESIILTKSTKLIPVIARGVRHGLSIDLKGSR